MPHKPLIAEAIAKVEFGRTYRARGWKFPQAMCDDLLSAATVAVQQTLKAYEGRGTIRLSGGKPVRLTRPLLIGEASRQARNAMRRLADGKKASTLSLGSGYRAELGQGEKGDGTLPAVDKTGVDRPATEDHDAVEQAGVSLGQYADADKQWRWWVYRAAKERAYARLTPAQQRCADMHPTTARERALQAEAREALRRNTEEAQQEVEANEQLAEAAVAYVGPNIRDLARFRERVCMAFPKARGNPASIALWLQLFGINIQK